MSNQNSTIKYSAIASAVALACAGAISVAGTIGQPTRVDMSLQGNQSAASTADNIFGDANFSVVLGTAYAINDTVVFGISGASFRTGGALPAPLSCNKAGSASTVVLAWLSKTSSQATLRVTEGTGLDGMTGASCTFDSNNFSFVRNSAVTLGASSFSLSMTSYVGGNTSQPFDTTTSRTVAGVANQFSSAIVAAGGFSGTVDVNVDRRAWVTGTTTRLSRTLSLSFTSTTAPTNAVAAAATSISVGVYGAAGSQMFSFLDDDANGCTDADLTAGAGTASVDFGTLSISTDCGTLTFTQSAFIGADSGASASSNRVITLTKATSSTGLQIADGSFSAAPVFTVSVSTTATQSITAFSAGSFDLNGTVITVPYMPYGVSGTQEISQVYSLANTSATSGTVTAIARNQSGSLCSLGSVGVAAARSVTNLSTAINQGIAACYAGSSTAAASAFPTGTRVFVTLTSNTPAANTIVNSTYNVGGSSRVNVVNTSTRVTNN